MQKEFERKALLSEAEFQRLHSYFTAHEKGDSYTQVNTYFDTESLYLAKRHITLRVRQKNGRLEQQYKFGQKKQGDLRVATEYNIQIDHMPDRILSDGLPTCDEGLVFSPLGALTTKRTDFLLEGALVSLDENHYFGYTDYEIEVESAADAPLPALVLSAGVDFSKPVAGKFHRFLVRLAAK